MSTSTYAIKQACFDTSDTNYTVKSWKSKQKQAVA